MTWELSVTVDPDTKDTSTDVWGRRLLPSPVFVEAGGKGIQIDCIGGTLRLKQTFDGGASVTGAPSEVRTSSGKILWIMFRQWSPTGQMEDLVDNYRVVILTFMGCCGPSLNRHQLVSVDNLGTIIELFRLSSVEPAYRELFFELR
jgi:hypothetical protein